jgi:hypothetical protein
MLTLLLIGGFFRSLQFTCINTLAYAEVETARISRATALVSVGQQLSLSAGVAVGALAVHMTILTRGGDPATSLLAADFPPAFLLIAAISAMSVLIFARLPDDAGAELANRLPIQVENAPETADPRPS